MQHTIDLVEAISPRLTCQKYCTNIIVYTQLAYRVTGVYIGIAAGCVAVVGAVVVAGIVVFRR